MAHKFDKDEKEVREFAQSMPFGVSEVNLLVAEAGQSSGGKDYIELTVINKDGLEDKARLWFVGGATNISFNTIRQIAVHNRATEDEKQAIGEAVDAVADTDELCDLINSELINGELWFTKYYVPEGDKNATYTNDYGTFRSINRNVYGYPPKLKPELMPRPKVNDVFPGSEQVKAEDYPEDEPFKSNPASTIPKDDQWDK